MSKISTKVQQEFRSAFAHRCIEAVQKGYDRMRLDKRYQVYWEEDNFTICLVETIKATKFLNQHRISVNHQPPVYSEQMAFAGENPLNAPRVDFKFSEYHGPIEYNYYMEAKNLSEKDWKKPIGTKVRAAYQRDRYIRTGIENYLSGRYPEGCLVAYVVNGKEANVLNALNRSIVSRQKDSPHIGLVQKDISMTFDICYCSHNQLIGGIWTLRHLFLQLA